MPHPHDHHHHADGHDHHPAGQPHAASTHSHAHSSAAAITLDPPVWSLVRVSLVERLGWALGAAALIWAATYLAIR